MWIYNGDRWVRKVMLGRKLLKKVMHKGELIWEYDPYYPKYYYWYNSLNNSTNTSSGGYTNKLIKVVGDPLNEPGTQSKLGTGGGDSGNVGSISGLNSGVPSYASYRYYDNHYSGNINFDIWFSGLDSMKEYTFYFWGFQDEEDGSYGNIRIYFNGTAYTPKEAMERKLIKPIFLVSCRSGGGSINPSTMINGGSQSLGSYSNRFQFCFQTNKGALLTRVTFVSPGETAEHCLWDSIYGRIVYDESGKAETTVYRKSQYKERYW